jgi:hypothetical protein
MSEKSATDTRAETQVESGKYAQASTAKKVYTKRPWWKIGGPDISFSPVDVDSVATSRSGSINNDIETNQDGKIDIHGSVFSDADAAEFYKPVETYEGIHRFDPEATWTAEEEQKLVRTVTWSSNPNGIFC